MDWKKLGIGMGWIAVGAWSAASAAAQVSDEESGAATDGLRARVELGVSPDHYGFAILCEGGEPFTRAVLQVRETSSNVVLRDLVQLDENGAWSRTLIGVKPARDLELNFVTSSPSGGAHVSNTVSIAKAGKAWASPFQSGQVLIREYMKDPTFVSDTKGEWFEVVNLTSSPIDIRGWKIADAGSNSHTIGASSTTPILLQPGVPFVLGNNATSSTNGGVHVDYKYSSFTLGNGADQIFLSDNHGVLVDAVSYDAGVFWPSTPGKSASLRPQATNVYDNDDPSQWCDASSTFAAGNPDRGTPGATNDQCP